MLEEHKVNINCNIQIDQIFIFKTKGSTFAAGQSNILLSPISNFEIFRVG